MSYRYDELTWPEVNDAVAEGKIPILAVGSVEQHGPHLPLCTDWLQAQRVVEEAARRSNGRLLVMPPVHYGYITHAMDFPGTVTVHWQHLIDFCLDITKSLAYHGFKKMIIVNGHGSNEPLLELVGRRTNLETDATCAVVRSWPVLLSVDPEFNAKWRESGLGGTGHACELETSLMLYLAPDIVKKENAKDFRIPQTSAFTFGDIYSFAPVSVVGWTSAAGTNGTFGRADLGTTEKGKLIFEETVKQLLAFVEDFHQQPYKPRVDHHKASPTTPVPG
jgi:creatinine amidohydrolase